MARKAKLEQDIQQEKEMLSQGMGDFSTELVVEGLSKVSKEVSSSMVTVSTNEARFLVDTYYQFQQARITADSQIRSIVQGADDNGEKIPLALKWVSANMANQEAQLKKMLGTYANSLPAGRWAMATLGIGPVLAAACLCYFDINKCVHYGQFTSFCGLNDYNNPWLGTDKAKIMVKQIYSELEESDKKFSGIFDIKRGEKYLKKLAKLDMYGAGEVYDACCADAKLTDMYNQLLASMNDDVDMVEDYIIRNCVNKNAVTEIVIIKTVAKSNRRRETVLHGLYNITSNKKDGSKSKKPVQYTRNDLSAYLAKPPYSKDAKQLVYLIGESFVKMSKKPDSLYGKIYAERKAYETAKNEKGDYAEQAAEALKNKNYDKDTESYKWYSEGKLPPMHIHRRSKRYAVKIFISHLFEAMYRDKYKKVPADIYPIAYMNHTDYIPPEVPFDKFIKIDE